MERVQLGASGIEVSRICLGMMSYGASAWRDWVLDEEESRPFVKRALELGLNFFDTADMYSKGVSEEVLGRALKDFARRDEVVVATKLFFPPGDDPKDRGLSRARVQRCIDDSLRRLDMDYVDLYQIHRWDPEVPIDETLEALHRCIEAGKVRAIGASSMYAYQFATALYRADLGGWSRFVSMQNHYNLVYREEEREMNPLCRAEGVSLIPWSPLARGFLAGNRTRDKGGETPRCRSDGFAHSMYYRDHDFAVLDVLAQVAEARGASMAQIALAWLLAKPGVASPIIGATKMRHLEESVAAASIKLGDDELERLESPYKAHPVLGHA